MRVDYGGEFWYTLFDVGSLIWSIGEVCANPSDAWAWVGLAGDVVDLIPFVSGVGETTRVVKTTVKIADNADDVFDAAKAIDNTIDSYKALKKANRGTGLEVHHIVEKRFAKDLDIENTGEMLSIALTKSEHRVYTNAWREQIPYATGRHSREEIWNAAKNIYADRPDLLEAARKTIFRR